MLDYLHWVISLLLVLIGASFKYAHSIKAGLDELSKYVYQLPCATTDVELELALLKKRLDLLELKQHGNPH